MTPITRNTPSDVWFNRNIALPYELRIEDFKSAMQDVYDFFYDVNKLLADKGLRRLDDMIRPAGLSGFLSDMLTDSIANHSRALVQNGFFNGHPDLVRQGIYPNNAIQAGREGVEIKATQKHGGAVDFHGARNQCLCVFVYDVDNDTEPAVDRRPLAFTEIYIATVSVRDFRKNKRGALGTRTATLDRDGIAKFRRGWLYLPPDRRPNLTSRPPRPN